jgi:hypothetical protein
MKKVLLAVQLFMAGIGFSAQGAGYTEAQGTIKQRVMSQTSMERIVKSVVLDAKGEKGFVEFTVSEVQMYLISDVTHDRMRIIAPVAEYKKLTNKQLLAIMESNFHKALDARYAVSEGVLYSVFIHSLSDLNEGQIKSAVEQVANLALSFGTQYTSGVLDYGGK